MNHWLSDSEKRHRFKVLYNQNQFYLVVTYSTQTPNTEILFPPAGENEITSSIRSSITRVRRESPLPFAHTFEAGNSTHPRTLSRAVYSPRVCRYITLAFRERRAGDEANARSMQMYLVARCGRQRHNGIS